MQVYLWKPYGQLGNRLQTFSNLVALASLRGWSVHNLSFAEYAAEFHHFREQPVASWSPAGRLSLWARLMCCPVVRRNVQSAFITRHCLTWLGSTGRLFEAPDDMEISENDLAGSVLEREPSWVVWTAWNLKFHEARRTSRELLREVFRPIDGVVQAVDRLLEGLPRRDRLVGVHVRRRDYVSWLGGRYFFSYEQYRALLHRISDLMSPLRVHFLVASDEPIPPELVSGFSATRLSGTQMEDLYSLARCDLIAGPPSTYSEWASFYGDVPWFVFRETLPESLANLQSAL